MMTPYRWAKVVSHITLTLCLLFLPTAKANADNTIVKIATGSLSGNYYPTGGAIAAIVNKNSATNGFRCVVEVSKGSIANIDAITAGHAQLAIVQSDILYQAVKGLGVWGKKGPQNNLSALFGLYNEAVTLVASGDSGVKNIQDLKGKRVHLGDPGSGGRTNAELALHANGVDWKKDIAAFGRLENVSTLFFNGKIHAFFKTTGHPNIDIRFATLSVPGARLISIENIEPILSGRPYYTKTVIPMRLYLGASNEKDVKTFGVKATLVASTNVPEPVIYAITKSIFNDMEEFKIMYPHLELLTQENMLECLTALIHPGAMKYYEEVDAPLPSYCLQPVR